MSDTVIRVENLGKKYVITHQQNERYTTLRDSLAKGARNLLQPFQNPKSSSAAARSAIQNPKSEEFWALKDVSFEIKQGDRVGIIGQNGAGKSTLLKILSRITEPTRGKIQIKGRVASLLEVGTGFHPELTGRENIYLNGAILGMSKAEIKHKFDEIVAFAEVEKFLDTPVKRYSSGMYVRLAFAVAAHLEPEILVVDEVLAVGDAAFQQKCLGKMQDVGKEGRTVIFVSHNMGAIGSLCNHGVVLKHGQLQYCGLIENSINYYLSNFARKNIYAPGILFKEDLLRTDKFKVLQVSILDEKSRLKPIIKTWDSIRLRIHYYSPKTVNRGSVVVEILTFSGTKLIQHSTQPLSGLEFSIEQGKSYIDCVIPCLPLAAGQYRLNIGLAVPMIEWLFWGEHIADLEVVEADVYQSKFPPNQERTPIVIQHHWEIYKHANTN